MIFITIMKLFKDLLLESPDSVYYKRKVYGIVAQRINVLFLYIKMKRVVKTLYLDIVMKKIFIVMMPKF